MNLFRFCDVTILFNAVISSTTQKNKFLPMKKLFLFGITSIALMSFIAGNKPSLKLAKKTIENFCVFVPSGNTLIEKDTVSVQSFYISKGEITNIQYAEFLADLKKSGEFKKLKMAQIDTNNWNTELKWENNKYADFYHKHPAYYNYPVVNVSKEGAELYCKWLTNIYDSLSNGEMKLVFRIPTHTEWLRVANGSSMKRSYSWSGPYLRNTKGQILANFVRFGAENITRNQESGQYEVTTKNVGYSFTADADVTAPSLSYWPNEFGIYNLNGNVSEMISDKKVVVGGDWRSPGYDIRNDSQRPYQGASVTVGFRVVASYVEN